MEFLTAWKKVYMSLIQYLRLVGSKNMFEYVSKTRKWSWDSSNSKHGDEIGVGGQKLELSSIVIELHIEP